MKIITGIVLVMRFMHMQDIVHEYLNPDNILLDDKFKVKICDIDIDIDVDIDFAKELTLGEQHTIVIGTSFYAALGLVLDESIRDVKKVGVCAFAMMLYEMLYGKNPEAKLSLMNVLAFYVKGEGADIGDSSMDRNIEGRVQDLIRLCWDQIAANLPMFDDIFRELQQMHFHMFGDMNVTMVERFVDSVVAFEAA
jgi:serine/threonine protein kinase